MRNRFPRIIRPMKEGKLMVQEIENAVAIVRLEREIKKYGIRKKVSELNYLIQTLKRVRQNLIIIKIRKALKRRKNG